MRTLGDRIKILRGSNPQRWLSEQLDIPQTTLSNYENNKSELNFAMIDAITSIFQVNTDWLLFGRDPMRPGEPTSEPQTPVEQPVIPTKTADHCPQCVELKVELEEERRERREKDKEVRELSAENRKLWKENGELKEENATLRERQRKTEIEVVFDERQNIPVSEARI